MFDLAIQFNSNIAAYYYNKGIIYSYIKRVYPITDLIILIGYYYV